LDRLQHQVGLAPTPSWIGSNTKLDWLQHHRSSSTKPWRTFSEKMNILNLFRRVARENGRPWTAAFHLFGGVPAALPKWRPVRPARYLPLPGTHYTVNLIPSQSDCYFIHIAKNSPHK
jgi:hypothetical protein